VRGAWFAQVHLDLVDLSRANARDVIGEAPMIDIPLGPAIAIRVKGEPPLW